MIANIYSFEQFILRKGIFYLPVGKDQLMPVTHFLAWGHNEQYFWNEDVLKQQGSVKKEIRNKFSFECCNLFFFCFTSIGQYQWSENQGPV